MQAIPSEFLGETIATLRKYKELGEGAIAQVADEELATALDDEGNSIAIIVKHLSGNMRSRWRDFLTSDGEKPDRDRDSEFVLTEAVTRETLLSWWEAGWRQTFDSLEALRPTDLQRTVTIRDEPLSVVQALLRQVTHTAYHVGQIVFLAKHHRSAEWKTLSMPRKL